MKSLYRHGTSSYLQQLKSKSFLFALAMLTVLCAFVKTNDTGQVPVIACHPLIKEPSGLIHYTEFDLELLHSIQPAKMNCTLSDGGASTLNMFEDMWLRRLLVERGDGWCAAIALSKNDPERIQHKLV